MRPRRLAVDAVIPSAGLLRRDLVERIGPFTVSTPRGRRLDRWWSRARGRRGLQEVTVPEVLLRRRLHGPTTPPSAPLTHRPTCCGRSERTSSPRESRIERLVTAAGSAGLSDHTGLRSRAVISDAVRSVLAPVCRDLEHFLVDDGSTDGTLAVLHEPRSATTSGSVLATEHGGPSAARNRALEVARGGFVTFLDSDDLMPPDRRRSPAPIPRGASRRRRGARHSAVRLPSGVEPPAWTQVAVDRSPVLLAHTARRVRPRCVRRRVRRVASGTARTPTSASGSMPPRVSDRRSRRASSSSAASSVTTSPSSASGTRKNCSRAFDVISTETAT